MVNEKEAEEKKAFQPMDWIPIELYINRNGAAVGLAFHNDFCCYKFVFFNHRQIHREFFFIIFGINFLFWTIDNVLVVTQIHLGIENHWHNLRLADQREGIPLIR